MRRVVVFTVTVLALTVIVVLRNGGLDAVGMGGDGSYHFLNHQPGDPYTPVTYSSCKPIRVQINTDGLDHEDAAKQVVLSAMGEISAATGLQIAYDGPTDRRPLPPAMRSSVPGGALPVLVAFATTSEVPALEGNAGLGGSGGVTRNGVETYLSGQITLNAETFNRLLDGPRGWGRARAIVMHELGHVVGLGHVRDRHEVMDKEGRGPLAYGPGDRRGLALLGKGPCS